LEGQNKSSGADIIRQGWRENGWPEPEIREHFGANTDRVELSLRLGTVSVLNPESKERGKETSKEKIKALMIEDKFITIGGFACLRQSHPFLLAGGALQSIEWHPGPSALLCFFAGWPL
jgi:hypothetical protein